MENRVRGRQVVDCCVRKPFTKEQITKMRGPAFLETLARPTRTDYNCGAGGQYFLNKNKEVAQHEQLQCCSVHGRRVRRRSGTTTVHTTVAVACICDDARA